MPERRRSQLVLGLLAALAAALGAYDTVVLERSTAAGGWPAVTLWSATAVLSLLLYSSPRARRSFDRLRRTRPAQTVLALIGLSALAFALLLVVDFVTSPPSEVEAVIAVGFWVVILGGAGVSVTRAVVSHLRHGADS